MNVPLARRVLPDLTQKTVVASRETTIRELFASGADDASIAAAVGLGIRTLGKIRREMKLHRRRGRTQMASDKAAGRLRLSRHDPHSLDDRIARMPAINHPALAEARTIYPQSVTPVAGLLNVLVRGDNSWKIGGTVIKGRWRGFPIFTLTLQERATCPVSCAHWRSCYGNAMNWAKRITHGPEFEERLGFEVGMLSHRFPAGFAVRLHVLGDFYSVVYVDLWRSLVERFPNLHVFGFSARMDLDDPIAIAVTALIVDHWPRFALRLSNAPYRVGTTVSIEHPLQKPSDAIVCPQQTGRTASCATCALCWSTDRRIAFLRH